LAALLARAHKLRHDSQWRFAAQQPRKADKQVMSGRPAVIRQRDCKQIINAAKKAGAKGVEFRIVVHLAEPADNETADNAGDNNNSFDKIMRKPGT
jgi:hypothetical protein